MGKILKYAFVFVSGVTVGIGVCSVKILEYALSDDRIGKVVGYTFVDKIDKIIYGKKIVY